MINDMNYLFVKEGVKLKKKIMILILFLIAFILFAYFYRIDIANTYIARVINNDGFNMEVHIPKDDLSFIDGKKLIIDNKTYDYQVINIEDSDDSYFVVDILVKLDSVLEVNYISVKQNVSNKRLFNIIISKIKKGLI